MKNLFGPQGPPGWLVTGGIACVAVAYVFLAFLPSQKGFRLMHLQLREKQKDIASTDKLFASVSLTRGRLNQASSFVKQWQKDAPATHDLSRIYAQVSDKARLAGVRLLRLDPQPARPHALVAEYTVSVSVEGTLEGTFNFFKGVEELPQTIWLRNINVLKAGETSENLRCDLTLTIFGDSADNSD
jgi:Tfp pilus assembly protein PilO